MTVFRLHNIKEGNKKLSHAISNRILGQLVANNLELVPQFVAGLKTDPLNSVRILSNIGDNVEPYLSDIKMVMNEAPYDSLKLFLKHDKIDADVLKFALLKASKPIARNPNFNFGNTRTTWNEAVDILAKKAAVSPEARSELLALIITEEWGVLLL